MDIDRLASRTKITAAIVAGFGALCALALIPTLSAPIAHLVDLLSWPMDGPTLLHDPEGRLVMAILAGALVGWGALIWLLSGEPMRASPGAVRRTVVLSVLVWFAVDSIGSLLAGAPLNVLSNAAFLAVLLAPLFVGIGPVASRPHGAISPGR